MDDALPDPTRTSPRPSSRAAARAPVFPPGAHVGPYVIEGLIAQGGSARVYRALDETLARHVALKVLDDASLHEGRERFLREVQIVAGLSHPHIVSLYAAGEEHGVAFAAMELLPGSLADELRRRGRLPWTEALTAARQACLGLDAARQRGIVHRDVKPSNLLRDQAGVIKVADSGLAKDLSSALELTMQGVVLGTPFYVSHVGGRLRRAFRGAGPKTSGPRASACAIPGRGGGSRTRVAHLRARRRTAEGSGLGRMLPAGLVMATSRFSCVSRAR